jgi:Fe-S oxidoreductase
VILWPDTFNNYFHPETAIAATEVLEAAGCSVTIPERSMCCGRPLYDYGFLTHAKQLLLEAMAGLGPAIRSGTPIVVLEPSCLAVFRDELVNLFPDNEDAIRLSKQTFLLSEFLRSHCPDFATDPQPRRVMLHGHCHHKAVAKLDDEATILQASGAEVETLDSGCCGMAGSFGFEADHYDLSIQVGELALLPAVRRAPADTVIVADGFSCREQIRQATGRNAIHLAEALRMGLARSSDFRVQSSD